MNMFNVDSEKVSNKMFVFFYLRVSNISIV